MKHSEAVKRLSELVGDDALVVTNLTTNARLWSALAGPRPSFYGLNMGLCLPFAVGLALAYPKRRVVALDGDGSLIIETSSMITAADVSPPNLLAVVFDNSSYGEMGATATARRTDLEKMGQGAGMKRTATVRSMATFEREVGKALKAKAFTFLVAKVEREKKLPYRGSYIARSERGMKENFVDALKALPDHPDRR